MRTNSDWEVRLKLAAADVNNQSLSRTLFDFIKRARRSRMSQQTFRGYMDRVVRPFVSQRKSIAARISEAHTVFAYEGDLSKLPNNLQEAARSIRHPPPSHPSRNADPKTSERVLTLLDYLMGSEHSKTGGQKFLVKAYREYRKYMNLPYKPLKKGRA